MKPLALVSIFWGLRCPKFSIFWVFQNMLCLTPRQIPIEFPLWGGNHRCPKNSEICVTQEIVEQDAKELSHYFCLKKRLIKHGYSFGISSMQTGGKD